MDYRQYKTVCELIKSSVLSQEQRQAVKDLQQLVLSLQKENAQLKLSLTDMQEDLLKSSVRCTPDTAKMREIPVIKASIARNVEAAPPAENLIAFDLMQTAAGKDQSASPLQLEEQSACPADAGSTELARLYSEIQREAEQQLQQAIELQENSEQMMRNEELIANPEPQQHASEEQSPGMTKMEADIERLKAQLLRAGRKKEQANGDASASDFSASKESD